MPPVGFEPTISAGERPQTYALDRAATNDSAVALIIHKGKPIWKHDISMGWHSEVNARHER